MSSVKPTNAIDLPPSTPYRNESKQKKIVFGKLPKG